MKIAAAFFIILLQSIPVVEACYTTTTITIPSSGSGGSTSPTDSKNSGQCVNLITERVLIKNTSNQEQYFFRPGEEIWARGEYNNIGSCDVPKARIDGNEKDYVPAMMLLSTGYKEDLHSVWKAVGGQDGKIYREAEKNDLDPGKDESETFKFNAPTTLGVYNLVSCIDRRKVSNNKPGDYYEIHESDNCSSEAVFQVVPLNPVVSTWGRGNVTQNSVILQGSINARGAPAYGYFDYGTSLSYGKTVYLGNIGSSNDPITKIAAVSGLTCGTTYYYRIRATNEGGTTNGASQSFSTSNCPGDTNDIKPVYGFWSPSVSGHHFTISETGKNNLINHPTWDWEYEGVYFHALTKQFNNAVPVYQLWKSGYGHHYTTSLNERNRLLNSGDGWTEGTVVFYAYPSQRPGTVPIYRYYSSPNTDHYFTRSAPGHYSSSCNLSSLNGKNALNSTSYNHCYEGIAWYAYPSMPAKPWVSTWGPANISRISATLQGRVNPYGTEGYAYFDYGENTTYGHSIDIGYIGHNNAAILLTKAIGGLQCEKTYHYRIRANNDGGVSYGPDVVFTTSTCPPPDTDGDGIPDESDNCPLKPNTNQTDFDGDGVGNMCDPDDDNDGLSDKDETNIYGTDPLKVDTDGDGLSDYEEVAFYGSNPLKTDTDGDGFSDGYEVKAGSNPTDPKDYPSNHRTLQVIIQYLLNNKK